MKKKFRWIIMLVGLLLIGYSFGQPIRPLKDTKVKRVEPLQMIEKVEQKDVLEEYMKQMTLEEKVGQLFMIAMRQDSQGNPITMITPEIGQRLKEIPVGGMILFKENISSPGQVKTFIADLQSTSTVPLWIGVDEEGGRVSRVGNQQGFTDRPFGNAFDMKQDKELAYAEASRMGKLLKDLGFNVDFAPDADIYNNPENTVIGERSFGTTEAEVTPMVLAFAKGLESEGIMPVVKHFPGHGNTFEDSHKGLAYVDKTLEELEKEEMIPFKAALANDIPMLMVGHLVVPDVDPDRPATVSKKWGDYLQAMGTEKVILITDAMEMGAITKMYTSGESALKVIESGYDMILMPENLQEAYETVLNACKEGKISEERIDKSVRKILSKKVENHLMVLE